MSKTNVEFIVGKVNEVDDDVRKKLHPFDGKFIPMEVLLLYAIFQLLLIFVRTYLVINDGKEN